MRLKSIWDWDLVRLFVLVSVLLFVLFFILTGINEAGLRQNIRWSARISFTLFCIAFSASAIHANFKNSGTYWLRMNRKYFGISFAIIHIIHLGFLISLQQFFHPVFELARISSLIGGGIAYLFVFLMLITSFDAFSKHLTYHQWKRLHTVGGYWIWSIYMTSYYKRALTEPWHWMLVTILLFVLGLRLYVLFNKKLIIAKIP